MTAFFSLFVLLSCCSSAACRDSGFFAASGIRSLPTSSRASRLSIVRDSSASAVVRRDPRLPRGDLRWMARRTPRPNRRSFPRASRGRRTGPRTRSSSHPHADAARRSSSERHAALLPAYGRKGGERVEGRGADLDDGRRGPRTTRLRVRPAP
jgi:hypothetical protein